MPPATLRVVYRVNDNPVETRWRLNESGTAILFQGEARNWLQTMPDHGRVDVTVQASGRRPIVMEYQLDGVSVVRRRIAKACNWSSS